MASETLYKILHPGQLIKLVNGKVGVIVSVEFEFDTVFESCNQDPCVYLAWVNGTEVKLIREAFHLL